MFQLLYKYFVLHKSAHIPGIGVFYVERLPARLDFANKIFIAPALEIKFKSQSAGSDNKLATFISREQKIAETEAFSLFNNFANTIQNSLKEQQSVTLSGIGILHQNSDGTLDFRATSLLTNFFPAASAERLLRENMEHHILVGNTSRTNTQMKEMLVDEPESAQEARDYWWVFAIILAIIGIAVIVYYYVHNGSLQ